MSNILFFDVAFYMNKWWATTATTSIFIIAAITDWLDGYIARKVIIWLILFSHLFNYILAPPFVRMAFNSVNC